MKTIVSAVAVGLLLTACAFTQSALEYSYEGTKRVDAGYKAKAEMTKYLTEYLIEANKGCGVKVEIINNTPVTTVKECVRADDVMASVDHLPIIKPQKIASITDGVGDMLIKATNIVVPVASIYYGYKNNEINQNANVAIRKSDNEQQASMWDGYTSHFQNSVTNTQTTDTSNTLTTNTTNTDKETTNVPKIKIDTNSTNIN